MLSSVLLFYYSGPHYDTATDPSHKSHNATFYEKNMHKCPYFCYKWSIVGNLSIALWGLWDGSITILHGILGGILKNQPFSSGTHNRLHEVKSIKCVYGCLLFGFAKILRKDRSWLRPNRTLRNKTNRIIHIIYYSIYNNDNRDCENSLKAAPKHFAKSMCV